MEINRREEGITYRRVHLSNNEQVAQFRLMYVVVTLP